jgi:hypothetical protein
MVFTQIAIARQPWIGTPNKPTFLTPFYRVEYQTGPNRGALEVQAESAIDARQIASAHFGIPFVMP